MGTVHQLIERHGVEAARKMADSAPAVLAVNAAAAVMAEEEMRLGITHAGFALTALPHKRIVEPVWSTHDPTLSPDPSNPHRQP